jgi:predicted transcriptional regulator
MLNVLVKKGKVQRTLKQRAFVYRPLVSRTQAMKQAMREMIDRVFGGSVDALVRGLVETRQLSAERLEALSRRIRSEQDAES